MTSTVDQAMVRSIRRHHGTAGEEPGGEWAMTEIYRLVLTGPLAFLLANAALGLGRAAAAICDDLPPSRLLVFSVKAPEVDEEEIPAASLDKLVAGALTFRHTMMLASTVLVSWFEIRHRPVPRPGGSVCDAPESVRMGFGAARRQVFLAEPAADDPCVRRKMLEHEADHVRAFDDAVDRFINDRRSEFARGMKALKQMPAPDAKAAAVLRAPKIRNPQPVGQRVALGVPSIVARPNARPRGNNSRKSSRT
jgi:hypothetical protein